MLGKMDIRSQSPIARAVGVLVLVVIALAIAFLFPVAATTLMLDSVLWVTGGILWMGLFVSRGYRNLVIGVIVLPIGLFLFNSIAGDLVSALVATGFAFWLVIGVVRKVRLQEQIARYLGGVALTCLGFIVVVPLMERDNKFHATLAFMLAAAAFLVWWNHEQPTALTNKPRDPWRWSRDKHGNWRA